MDPSEELLTEVLATLGCDLWSLIDTAIAVAARDCATELRLRREAIVQALYALTPCRNCDPNRSSSSQGHVPNLNHTNADGSVASPLALANGDGSSANPVHGTDASPEMRSPSPLLSPEVYASPEQELGYMEGEEENKKEVDIHRLEKIQKFLKDPELQADDEAMVSMLQNLAEMEITYAALNRTSIGLDVNALRKHPCEEVRQLVKDIISKWKGMVGTLKKTNFACEGSSSPPVATGNGSPQRIPAKSHRENSNGPHDFIRSPKRQGGAGPAERNGSDSLNSKTSSGSRRDPPARPSSNNRPSTSAPSHAPPANQKRKEKEDSLSDQAVQARLDSARKRLQENYQEAQNAKKQRTVQVMSINEIPKPRNAFIRRGGSSSRGR